MCGSGGTGLAHCSRNAAAQPTDRIRALDGEVRAVHGAMSGWTLDRLLQRGGCWPCLSQRGGLGMGRGRLTKRWSSVVTEMKSAVSTHVSSIIKAAHLQARQAGCVGDAGSSRMGSCGPCRLRSWPRSNPTPRRT